MFTSIKKYFPPTLESTNLYRLVAHVALVYFIFTGTLHEWLIALCVYFFAVTIGGTITLHRLLAHKSFVAPKWFEYLGSTVSTLCGSSVSALAWVALHREHHRYTDTEKDPHSPKFYGYWRVQFRDTKLPNFKYIPDLARDKVHVFLHNYHWPLVLVYAFIVYCFDPRALLYFWLVPGILVWHGGSLTNTLNHSPIGYRNYKSGDDSINNPISGILVSGEGWHNNHHSYPQDPKLGHKWWEFDLGWQIIKLVRLDKENNNRRFDLEDPKPLD